ncbi:MAG: bifunctional DNA-formamidopyrimidine glycosylase/DNA-(apurinic or apyrimidinic site) lyase [Acetobacterales bacterium]
MPELPEVETVCRGLSAVMPGRRILRADARRPDLRFPLPERFAARLAGRIVESVSRRAKYIRVFLDDGQVLVAHLGMSGRMLIGRGDPPVPAAHEHVLIELDSGDRIAFADPRRFGFMDLIPADGLDSHPWFAQLGPEPLGNAFDAATLSAALHGRRTPIKAALLDQRVVAGLGNIYVCESLFRAAISPRRLAASVAGARAERLVPAIRDVLNEAIEAGGSTLRDHKRPTGELGYFQHSFRVYGREGEPCPGCDCGKAVQRIVQSGRSTFYCPVRQR